MTSEKTHDNAASGGPASARSRLKSRKTLFALGAAVIVLTTVLGYPLYLRIMSHATTDDAFVEAHVISMSPRVDGHVAEVPVHDNQWVEKGDLLVRVDPRTFEVALDIARARLQSANAAREEAEAEVAAARSLVDQRNAALSSNRSELAQARAGVEEYAAGHDRDQNDFKRMDEMVEAGAVSRQEYDHARAQAAVSRAKLLSARKRIDTQSAQIRQAVASAQAAGDGLRQAQAAVVKRQAEAREAEAEVRQAELDLSYTRITAPCAGFVTKKSVEPGAYVQVGQKLLSVVGRDVWVVANFKETQIAGMRPGQPVDIEVDAYPGRTFEGHVDSIQRGTGSRFTLLPPENATGNFIKVVQRVPVKIVLDHPNGEGGCLLAPGMSVIPSVDVAARADARHAESACADAVPATAVQ
ncbi:secretion protein HlyD family protein [Pseudodesulfovibrio mercurii]|uniref:Secretion protein HlyD family protein n=1 Tax=Pseudodesulfovibrio mercurii TaxID=641491 RepID=F0JBZ0_9BACT|nr:HlyD family secretion protein [Pseudodesulfovibrio mercurii]EGB14383.1 secretion protein HlyD family protein [Pseudodesulfovibrio mercurii]